MSYDLVAGDRGSKLIVTCRDRSSNSAINLSGKTVELRYQLNGGTVQTRTMTVTDGPAGKAEYQFTASDLAAGTLTGEIRISPGQTDQLTSVTPFYLAVRAALGA